jgi:hypothetical protein
VKTRKGTIKLADIVIDPNVQVREVELATVSVYRQSMKAGAVFPPIIVDAKTSRLVAGHHRYTAYRGIYDPDYEVPCTFMDFENDAAIIRFAAKDNAQHGRPLDTWDKKRIVIRLQQLGDSDESIAALLGVSVAKIEDWAGMTVIVRGENGQKQEEPVKRSWESLVGQTVTRSQYEAHAHGDLGIDAYRVSGQLLRWLKVCDKDQIDEQTKARLTAIHVQIGKMFQAVAA